MGHCWKRDLARVFFRTLPRGSEEQQKQSLDWNQLLNLTPSWFVAFVTNWLFWKIRIGSQNLRKSTFILQAQDSPLCKRWEGTITRQRDSTKVPLYKIFQFVCSLRPLPPKCKSIWNAWNIFLALVEKRQRVCGWVGSRYLRHPWDLQRGQEKHNKKTNKDIFVTNSIITKNKRKYCCEKINNNLHFLEFSHSIEVGNSGHPKPRTW